MLNKNLTSDLEQLKKEIWYIKKTLIPSLQSQISNSSGGGDTSSLTTQLTTLQNRVTTLEGQVSALQSSVTGNSSSITTISSDLSSLATRVTALESSSGSGSGSGSSTGETIELIYDMRSTDPNINKGFTDGAVGGKIIRTDFSRYRSIRIYASINGCEVQKVVKTTERKAAAFFMSSMNALYDTINFQRINFPLNLSAFQVSGWAIYTFNLTTGALSIQKGSMHSAFYVYRLEGIL